MSGTMKRSGSWGDIVSTPWSVRCTECPRSSRTKYSSSSRCRSFCSRAGSLRSASTSSSTRCTSAFTPGPWSSFQHKKLFKLLQEPGLKALVQRGALQARPGRKAPAGEQKLRHLEEELYFVLDERGHSVHLTDQGVETMSPQDPDLFLVPDISHAVHEIEHDQDLSAQQKIERRRAVEAEYALKSETLHIIHKLLQAHALYEKDVDYVVQDGKVLIVDEFTGRLMHGRRWSEGLHQAVEAKESVAVQEETQTLATITIQNYFRMYDKLAGMKIGRASCRERV